MVNYYPIRDLNSQTSYPESGQVTSVLRSRFVPHSAMAVCFIVFVGSVDFIIAFFFSQKEIVIISDAVHVLGSSPN